MSSSPVEVTRTGASTFTASNDRGGSVEIAAAGMPDAFTPGELLLAAIAGCAQLTGQNLLVRRLGEEEPITARAERTVNEQDPETFESVRVSFDVDLSAISDETERTKLVEAVRRAIGRHCTVSRSVERGTPITFSLPS
ncbi:osmotically inducible protein OsmC [Actinopolyspora erythraea]|uniref:Osmotically inducible protein OsmC n=1 Tax=Actinopolyspora erythraea TaxID=414996 RepID=A0A099D4R9_9ACTN|nr:OsmC family protein [Actinopolyspora erythraea]ASU79368.1 osmotically inducible protein OsmC [Actinopolyspora erythraea]KGI80822.1 osmotically inducible protein OsmC [Actinopolyspora erythraea]